jgi:hypothetical protein
MWAQFNGTLDARASAEFHHAICTAEADGRQRLPDERLAEIHHTR